MRGVTRVQGGREDVPRVGEENGTDVEQGKRMSKESQERGWQGDEEGDEEEEDWIGVLVGACSCQTVE